MIRSYSREGGYGPEAADIVAKQDEVRACDILKASGEEVFVIGEIKKLSNNNAPVQYI